MYHEQLVKHNNLNTKMNLHNDDDNVNDGDIHVIIIMLAYNIISLCYILKKCLTCQTRKYRCLHLQIMSNRHCIYNHKLSLYHHGDLFKQQWDIYWHKAKQINILGSRQNLAEKMVLWCTFVFSAGQITIYNLEGDYQVNWAGELSWFLQPIWQCL